MALPGTIYDRTRHAAARTSEYLFHQLIPYIGNKRKLLRLIQEAVAQTTAAPGATLVDFFAGSGVVSRWAKLMGYRVMANDWEPYAQAINRCYIACNQPPAMAALGGYEQALEQLNRLPPAVGWVTEHLCPRDDVHFDVGRDRMFYMRKNGMRIDAIRGQIAAWKDAGQISEIEEACLLAPLLYQACYTSNTSGVFKGFHNGWGGQTGTALYRIAADLRLGTPVFWDNGLENQVVREDAQTLAERLGPEEIDIAYLDPPYNQHPYGSNYHVLNSLALWDKPALGRANLTGHEGRHPHRLAHRAPQRVQLSRRSQPGLRSAAANHPRPLHPHQLQHRRHDPAWNTCWRATSGWGTFRWSCRATSGIASVRSDSRRNR